MRREVGLELHWNRRQSSGEAEAPGSMYKAINFEAFDQFISKVCRHHSLNDYEPRDGVCAEFKSTIKNLVCME